MRIKLFLLFILLSGVLISCEKDITVDLPKAEKKIVIEGAIEQGQYPWVVITRNSPYFEPLNFNFDSASIVNLLFHRDSSLLNIIVLNAVVTVTDGIIVDTLRLTIDPNQLPYFKYRGSQIIGQAGKTYSLKVIADGKTFTASTSIPNPVSLDSIKFKLEPTLDSLGTLWFYFKDPDVLGNCYRYFTKTIGKDSVFVHPASSVADDKLYNGKYVEYNAFRGRNPINSQEQNDDYHNKDNPGWAFKIGETVIFKFCSLDYQYYKFLYSVEAQMYSDGNPFSSPSSVITNIEGGALGAWGGYGVYVDTLHIQANILLK